MSAAPDAGADVPLFVHEPALAGYRLAEGHPFEPARLEALRTLLDAWELLPRGAIVPPTPLAPRELARVHDEEYLAAVAAASEGDALDDAWRFGLGTADTPIWRGMHADVARVCAATATAVEAVADGRARRAAAFSGGLHHAMPGRASGFCVYNDVALAVTRALDRGLRVACLDLDVHHGDGVQELFYDREDVLTLSLHESGRYLFPGTGRTYEIGAGAGRGRSVNVPLEPFTEDASYLEVLELVAPRALRAFRPDLIVLQAGADPHRADPLADLCLSGAGLRAAHRRVVALADELCGGRIVLVGGGGYDPWRTAPRVWAQAWAALLGVDTPARTPREWREAWAERTGVEPPAEAVDGPDDHPPQPRREAIASHNRAVAKRLLRVLGPLWERSEPTHEGARAPGR